MRSAFATLALTISLCISGETLAAQPAQETLPCLPTLEKLTDARLAAISPKHATEQKKIEKREEHNDWIDKLLLERITGSYSFGKGLTVDDVTQSGPVRNLVETDKSAESWSVTYAIPLSIFRQKFFTDQDAKADLAVLFSQQRLERQQEGLNINSLYNDYLESRTSYRLCGDDACRFTQGYKMRKLAISLLVLTDLDAPSNCPPWDCFPDKANCGSGMQAFVSNIQGSYSEEAQANLDWCIGNSGSPDCPGDYAAYPECLVRGQRNCLMEKAINLAKAGNCDEAFRLSLICQCHNAGAQQSLRSAGQEFVCSYLRSK